MMVQLEQGYVMEQLDTANTAGSVMCIGHHSITAAAQRLAGGGGMYGRERRSQGACAHTITPLHRRRIDDSIKSVISRCNDNRTCWSCDCLSTPNDDLCGAAAGQDWGGHD